MKKIWLVTMAVLAVVAVAGLSGCVTAPSGGFEFPTGMSFFNNQQQGIWVTGLGEVMVVPDVAVVSLGVSAQANTIAEAQSKAATAMDAVIKALTGNGVAQKDIQTQQFSITQLTRWDNSTNTQVVIGYQVNNTVVAKIRTIDKAGTIIDAVAVAGGDLTRVNGISFSIDDPTSYQKTARDAAMANAKAKADQMATLGGVRLGKPTYITESVSYPYPTPVYNQGVKEATAPVPTTPISVGELKVTVNVQVTYSILN